MKKLILSLPFILLSAQAFCQSITLSDLEYLLSNVDRNKFLTAKSYKVVQQYTGALKSALKIYTRTEISGKSETVIPGLGFINKKLKPESGIAYTTSYPPYIDTFLKQINQSNFHLVTRNADAKQDFYLFKGKNLDIRVYRKKTIAKARFICNNCFNTYLPG